MTKLIKLSLVIVVLIPIMGICIAFVPLVSIKVYEKKANGDRMYECIKKISNYEEIIFNDYDELPIDRIQYYTKEMMFNVVHGKYKFPNCETDIHISFKNCGNVIYNDTRVTCINKKINKLREHKNEYYVMLDDINLLNDITFSVLENQLSFDIILITILSLIIIICTYINVSIIIEIRKELKRVQIIPRYFEEDTMVS